MKSATNINPHKPKYFDLYWDIAHSAAKQSVCTRRQVGACLVTPTGMISIGWNGTPPGLPNVCEDAQGASQPYVIHAERNAIDKMTRQGISTYGSILFVTTAPCYHCALAIHGLGLKTVYYDESYRYEDGVDLLISTGTPVYRKGTIYYEGSYNS